MLWRVSCHQFLRPTHCKYGYSLRLGRCQNWEKEGKGNDENGGGGARAYAREAKMDRRRGVCNTPFLGMQCISFIKVSLAQKCNNSLYPLRNETCKTHLIPVHLYCSKEPNTPLGFNGGTEEGLTGPYTRICWNSLLKKMQAFQLVDSQTHF